MPIEIRRFGVGHRRPEGPPGTVGIEGQVIHGDSHGVVAELAFGRRAAIAPHSNPNLTYFIVIEGGGWVQVGAERARVQAGEAVVWPGGIEHGAWTDGWPMRALVVEFADGPAHLPAILEGRAAPDPDEMPPDRIGRGEGSLAPRPMERDRPGDPGVDEGEPL
jgi:quercetin dioxygenase-like cupin family protein